MPRFSRRGILPSALARAASFALILFALLPWTAPFATLDMGSSGDDRPTFDGPKKSKTFEDAIVMVARETAPGWLGSKAPVRPLISAERPATASHRLPLRI